MKRMDLKNASGLSYPYIAEIENGGKYPSQQALAKLADALGMTVLELLSAADALERGDAAPADTGAAAPMSYSMPQTVGAASAPSRGGTGDDTVERVTAAVYAVVEPRMREWLTREIQLAVREELLRQREGR